MNKDLLARLKKAGSVKLAQTLDESSFFNAKDMIQTDIPALNIALSGSLNGGLTPGVTVLAGPSRHFKSLFGLVMVKAYLDKYEDAVCLFADTEFGITPEYIRAVGIDSSRILHVPIEHIEQLKFDLVKRLEEINRGDRVIVFIDSVGNLASKKEVEDAHDEKSVADMTRAKALKSLFRIITPHFTTKDIPCVVVGHVYQELALYPKTIMSGGTGMMYSANQVFFIGKQQEKAGTELKGYNFVINVEKSRFVREKSKIAVQVMYEGGINKWSGLLDIALDGGFVTKPSNGWYQVVDTDTGEVVGTKVRATDTNKSEFWKAIIANPKFDEYVRQSYQVSSGQLIAPEIDEVEAFVNE